MLVILFLHHCTNNSLHASMIVAIVPLFSIPLAVVCELTIDYVTLRSDNLHRAMYNICEVHS